MESSWRSAESWGDVHGSWVTVDAKNRGSGGRWVMTADGETRSRGTRNWRENNEGGTRNCGHGKKEKEQNLKCKQTNNPEVNGKWTAFI